MDLPMNQQGEDLQWFEDVNRILAQEKAKKRIDQRLAKKRKRNPDTTSSSSSSSSVGFVEEMRVTAWGNQSLRNADPDIFELMEEEKERQLKGIALVPSDNFVCKAAMEALGSHLVNNYILEKKVKSNGCGNWDIDQIETLCRQRALAAFGLDSENWGVNVYPYSCTSANFAVYLGLLKPGDKVLGFQITCLGKLGYVQSLSYKLNPETRYLDYDKLEEQALEFRPNLLVCGGYSYPRELDYARFRQIADKCGAVLMCDMSHSSGLVAAKECASPFDCCDIVTSTTHESLGGIIFCRKTQGGDFERKIDLGQPHINHIAALAIALKQVASPEYKMYMQQVKKNAQAFASVLLRKNCRLITGGTDNHMVLWDLRSLGLPGFCFKKVCEMCHITLSVALSVHDNKHYIAGSVRIGTAAMTSRGCLEHDFEFMAGLLVRAEKITCSLLNKCKELQKPFLELLENNIQIIALRALVDGFASQFPMPGFDG